MKKKILALSLILTFVVTATGCNQGESVQTSQITTRAASAEQTTTTTVWDEWDTPETSEPEREIKTSAETKEELIAIFLKAFAEKDEETLAAFGCGNYDKLFNNLCKALDKVGNLPENLDEIELDPKLFEVFYKMNSVGSFKSWEATYPLANGKFTFDFKFNDYDYGNKSYSIKSVECEDRLRSDSLKLYQEAADTGEPLAGGVSVERLDITPYLD